MKPTLVVNPANDRVFAAFAALLVDHGAATTAELERRLRAVYPVAVVHARLLVGEPLVIWYVYREGRWVDTGLSAAQRIGRVPDARFDRRPALDRTGHQP
jgi:hypothetical protein